MFRHFILQNCLGLSGKRSLPMCRLGENVRGPGQGSFIRPFSFFSSMHFTVSLKRVTFRFLGF